MQDQRTSFDVPLPVAEQQEIDRLCSEFEGQWRRGERPRIEDYLPKVAPPLVPWLLKELVAAEIDLRRAAGDDVQVAEYLQRFPDHAAAVEAGWALIANRRAEDPGPASTQDFSRDHDQDTGGDQVEIHPDPPQPLPDMIGRYKVVRELGEGGFGRVLLAQDTQLRRHVAIKVPGPKRLASAKSLEAFLEEARTAAQLKHPGLVVVHDVQQDEGHVYIVQEYIDGQDLSGWKQTTNPSTEQIIALVKEVVEAVGFAHQHDLVHRDLKPANLLVDQQGHPHVADFGLAVDENSQRLRQGEVSGTPAYMSPEQVRGLTHVLDGRSDLWSIGVILYELLADRRPFRGSSTAEIFESVKHRDPKPPRQIKPSVPSELARICLKCLQKRQTDRYASAAELLDDLEAWCRQPSLAAADLGAPGTQAVGAATTPPQGSQEAGSTVAPSDTKSDKQPPPRIVPKGLRSFDEHDADFFLELLPGARDRDGLPESIRFWKLRIEETDPEKTFRVGLIYGPSGCGKSSLVKAGLLPRLASHVVPVYLEAAPEDTELRLLKGLRRRFTTIPEELALPDVLAGIREGQWVPETTKVCVVLDQFEQWLHTRSAEQDTQLVQALRQCEGSRLQAVVLVRDDFWMAATRFMRDLEVPVLENHNSAVVDLFDPLHARNVLAAFGRAYSRFPDETTALSRERETFLDRAVAGLAQDGKIICVRLALFADMLKGKPWTTATLTQVGGTEGLGVTFLEETFSVSTAPAGHRHHEKAAQAVLRTLLPEAGSDIKGSRQSYATLMDASGYAQRPAEFSELIRILDSEIRLITPTVPEGEDARTSHDQSGDAKREEKYYQLTHDYLVPSLREWLTRKQKETRRGRAELRLVERSALWNAKPENQQLPSWWEDLGIRFLTDRKRWTEPQRKMMRRAGWVHGSRSLITALLLLLFGWAGFEVYGRVQAHNLLTADPATLPSAIAQLSPWQIWSQWYLAEIIQRPPQDDDERREQLHARLASASLSGTYDPEVLAALYDCSLPYVGVIRDVLQPHREQFVASLWNALHDASQPAQRRFRCGLLLAGYEPSSSQWQPEGYRFLTEQLLDTSFEFQGAVRRYLRPLREQLVPQLETYLGNEAVRESWQVSAATALADLDFSGAGGATLADWLTKASDNQYARLYPLFEAIADPQALSRLKQLVEQTPSDETQSERVQLGRRRAGAAITLLRQSKRDEVPEDMFAALRVTDDPESLSQFVHGCRGREITVQQLWQCIVRADQLRQQKTGPERVMEDRVLFGLLLALGDTPVPALPLATKDSCIAQLTEWYATDPSSAIHGATGWLLKRWGFTKAVTEVDHTPLPYDETGRREWFVMEITPKAEGMSNSPSGLLSGRGNADSKIYFTFVVFPAGEFLMGSPEGEAERESREQLHRVRLTRPLAVSVHEVIWAQYDPMDQGQTHQARQRQFNRKLSPAEPVVGANWFEAVEYCWWLTAQAGHLADEQCYEDPQSLPKDAEGNPRHTAYYPQRRGFRLPTEAEWEYVCRSGVATAYSFGNDPGLLADYGWFAENSRKWSRAVGQLHPNLRGLFDVHGNLFEWTQDWYGNYSGDTSVDPPGATRGSRQVARGGGWDFVAADCRAAYRLTNAPTIRSSSHGFRLALSPSGVTPEAVEDKQSEASGRKHGGSAAEPRPEMP